MLMPTYPQALNFKIKNVCGTSNAVQVEENHNVLALYCWTVLLKGNRPAWRNSSSLSNASRFAILVLGFQDFMLDSSFPWGFHLFVLIIWLYKGCEWSWDVKNFQQEYLKDSYYKFLTWSVKDRMKLICMANFVLKVLNLSVVWKIGSLLKHLSDTSTCNLKCWR